MDRPYVSGIFNIGTGASRYLNDVTLAVINAKEDVLVALPERLVGW